MKKIYLSFLLVFLPFLASADPVEIDGIYYNLVKKIKEAEVASKPGYSGNVVIPSTITYDGVTYKVTSIGGGAFTNSDRLLSVVIPDGVKTIGERAFSDCEDLSSITIPQSLTDIGKDAFVYSYNIKEVYISDLEAWFNIDFESDVSNPLYNGGGKNYPNHLYLNNEEILELTIPQNVTAIKKYAFIGASSIVSITFHEDVKSIGEGAFDVTPSLTSVYISDLSNWMNIKFADRGSNPFNTYSLNSDHKLYLHGEEIKDLVIPNDLTFIGDYAFVGCCGFSSINIPSSVNSIGRGAFMGCYGLTSITIPDNVTNIGTSAFEECIGLKQTNIPNNLISIEESVWAGCKSLEKVEIPTSVTTIGKGSFRGCEKFVTITIPNSVISIGNYAFWGCLNLETISIGSGIEKIGDQYDVYLTPGGYVFSNCPEIKDVYCLAESVPATQTNSFKDSYIEYATLHVPEESVDAYKVASPWSSFKNIVAIDATDIKSLEGTAIAPSDVYDQSGRKVLTNVTSLEGLPNGIYIVKGKKILKK